MTSTVSQTASAPVRSSPADEAEPAPPPPVSHTWAFAVDLDGKLLDEGEGGVSSPIAIIDLDGNSVQ
jgi:hypothetical protein